MSETRAIARLVIACSVMCAGCYAVTGEDPYETAPEDDLVVFSRRGPRQATWFLVKLWTEDANKDSPEEGAGPALEIESFKRDVRSAGLRLSVSKPPNEKHESLLLRKSQSGFVAIARNEKLPPLEIAGRPLGGGDTRADFGLDIVPELLPDGRVSLDIAPLFRKIEGIDEGEIRAHALSFGVEIASGSTLLVESTREPADPVVRSLFLDAEGNRRKLWLQVELLR